MSHQYSCNVSSFSILCYASFECFSNECAQRTHTDRNIGCRHLGTLERGIRIENNKNAQIIRVEEGVGKAKRSNNKEWQ